MLELDALDGNAPTVALSLGTSSIDCDPKQFYRAREYVVRAMRRRWPDFQYVYRFEMTTGYGPRSGGKRRPHSHWMCKNVPVEDVDQAVALAVRVWCENVDGAEPQAQWGGPITAAPGLIRYITSHFGKESQAPPADWKGKREVRSLGYFDSPVEDLRARARDAIARRRIHHRLRKRGLEGLELELEVALELVARERRTWTVYVGDGGEESYFLYERDRLEGKLGGWRAAATMAPPWRGIKGESATETVTLQLWLSTERVKQ